MPGDGDGLDRGERDLLMTAGAASRLAVEGRLLARFDGGADVVPGAVCEFRDGRSSSGQSLRRAVGAEGVDRLEVGSVGDLLVVELRLRWRSRGSAGRKGRHDPPAR